MIRLGTQKTAPQRLILGPGASILYRPLTAIDREAGLAASRRAFEAAKAGHDAMSAYGLAPDAAWQDDADFAVGLASLVSLVEMALRVVVAWEGIGDAEGAPVPVTRENLATLLADPFFFTLVQQALMAPILDMEIEGNGSAPSRNGAPAGESPTAPLAPGSAPPAPAESPASTASAVPSTQSP